MMAAIQSMIDQKVEEKCKVMMAQYEETMKSVKKDVVSKMIKKPERPVTTDNAKKPSKDLNGKDNDEHSTSAVRSNNLGAGLKKPAIIPKVGSSKQRSDSKDSSKGEDKKKDESAKDQKKEEAKRRMEEAKAKREELERKKKEDYDKKQENQDKKIKKPEDKKSGGGPQPNISKIGGGVSKKGKDDAGDDDDPIAKSLNLRIAAGGVTQVVSKPGGGAKPAVSLPTGIKKPKDKTEQDGSAAGETPKNTKSKA